MKILLLSQFFSSTKGGGENVFSLIAKKLAENDHKVWVITNKIQDEEYQNIEGIKIIFVPPTLDYRGGLPPGFLDNLSYSFNAFKKGSKLIKKEEIDIIHSNNFAPALAGSFLSFFSHKPHITTIHDVFSLCGKNYWKKWGSQNNVSKINVALAPFFEKLLIKLNLKGIHTVSEASRDDLIQFGAKKPIFVVPNSIDRRSLTKSEVNPFQLVYIGRLVFYKNLEVVIKAIKIVKNEFPKIKLIIVGGGPHRAPLENLVNELQLQENIEFVGFTSEEKKTFILASSNSLVFPSLCEGFGLVILEAFSQQKPVLVSNVKPLSDIINHEKTGFVISPHDEKEWADRIMQVIKNSEKTHQMGLDGQKELEAKYNPKEMIKKIENMYNKILNMA